MKKLLSIIGSGLLVFVTGCQSLDAPDVEPMNETVSHTISVEDALANLKSFMSDANTRAVDPRKVGGVLTVKYKSATTRSGATVADCENLIYVANFEDEQGYAILAADDRIDEPVLAITDQGNLTDENIDDAVDAVVNPQRDFFEGYPATGPGIYTLPETGDQLYMNPNTVNLYLADKDDTLVGNFVPKTTVSVEGPDSTRVEDRGDSDIDPASVETLPTSLCVIYALQSVSTNRYRKSAPSDTPYPNPNDTISRDCAP